jgi:AAA domain
VLWVEGEDPAPQVLRPRFEAAGACCERIIYMKPQQFRMIPDLGVFLGEHGIRLVVLSPLTSSLCLRDSAKDEDVRRALEPLQEAIEAVSCALIGIMHLNKKPDLDAVERMLGSVAFGKLRALGPVGRAGAGPRYWGHGRGPTCHPADGPREMERRNERRRSALHIPLCRGRPAWPRPAGQDQLVGAARGDIDARRLFDRPRVAEERPPTAASWLIRYLQEHGPTPRATVIEAGADAGHGESALEQARRRNPRMTAVRTSEMPARTIWTLHPLHRWRPASPTCEPVPLDRAWDEGAGVTAPASDGQGD